MLLLDSSSTEPFRQGINNKDSWETFFVGRLFLTTKHDNAIRHGILIVKSVFLNKCDTLVVAFAALLRMIVTKELLKRLGIFYRIGGWNH